MFCKEDLYFRTIQKTCIFQNYYHPTHMQYNFRKSKPFSDYIRVTWYCGEWKLQTHFNKGHTCTHPFLALCLFLICCNTDLCCANATVTHLCVWAVHRYEINITHPLWLYYYTRLVSVELFVSAVVMISFYSDQVADYTLSIDLIQNKIL